MKHMAWYAIISTWFGSGNSKFAPGTVGSLATLPFAYMLHIFFGWQALMVASIAAFMIGTLATEYYLKKQATSADPKEVVIDEVAGQMLALTLVAPSFGGYLLGFVLFRLFDVLKPWPISLADRKVKGALGVMLDDMLAGLAAMFLPIGALMLTLYFEHGAALTQWLNSVLVAYVPR